MSRARALILIAAVAGATVLPAAPALANTAPNTYSPSGASWVTVDPASRVYLENFGSDYDDYGVFQVPAGVTCTSNSVTATGPFLTAEEVGDGDCIDSSSNAIDPIDTATRAGAVPLGFDINFFGTTYTDAYMNTNGGITFDRPSSRYDRSLAELANNAQSSAMYPLAADLYYYAGESNLWTGSTTINGQPAVVFSWENFHNCCTDSPSTEDMSFQLVIIDLGGGDFDAWFNFESFEGFTEGYDAPVALVDLKTGVTPGSNILVAKDLTNVPTTCVDGNYAFLGTPTDAGFRSAIESSVYFRVEDAAARTISVWSDAACTTPINPTLRQDETADRAAYLQLSDASDSGYSSVGSGWSTYNQTTSAIDATELLYNVNADELADTGTSPLIQRSWNTTVPGRFVIGQRGGATVGDPSNPVEPTPPAPPAPAPAPELAETGADAVIATQLGALAALLVGSGIALVIARRHRALNK